MSVPQNSELFLHGILLAALSAGFLSFAGPETHAALAEPLGPSSRRTGLVISEIMYHPLPRPDGKNLEFIELYNSEAIPADLSGYRLSGDVEDRDGREIDELVRRFFLQPAR